MSYILHLSDLHLGSKQVTDDFKNDIVAIDDRPNRISLLKNTFEELGNKLRHDRETLDAVVITGDITVGNDPEGFKILPELLRRLKNSCPPNDKVVIVPGNHDVTWRTPHGSKERYDNFLKLVRNEGYITPFLDGIDIKGNAKPSPEGHYLIGPDCEWLIVPVNSANYCGSLAPIPKALKDKWGELPRFINHKDTKRIEEELSKLLLHDVARISEAQLNSLRHALSSIEKRVGSQGKSFEDVIKIVAIHHHLLPVSETEEFKSFESITNLSLLRGFLLSNDINVVLHGHKHTGYIYWDHIYGYSQSRSIHPHCTLIISGATLGQSDHSEIGRLIKIESYKRAPTLSIAKLGAIRSGTTLQELKFEKHKLWEKDHKSQSAQPRWNVIEGDNSDIVYSKIRSTFDDLPLYGSIQYVMCTVKNTSTADKLPKGYPEDINASSPANRQEWFSDLIKWWQRPNSNLSERLYFTHGSRIYHYKSTTEGGIDQFKRAAARLQAKTGSSRALITLFNPTTDEVHVDPERFPSFCLVQFIIRNEEDKRVRKLDCVGYFRKQEMKYWWPVNVAELSHLQTKMHADISKHVRGLEIGAITTIAVIAHAAASPPKVAIPVVDRVFDGDPEVLWSMVHNLFWPDERNKDKFESEWERFLSDLTPAESADPEGIPVAIDGIGYLYDVAKKFAKHHPDFPASKMAIQLEELYDANKHHAEKILNDKVTEHDHERWRKKVSRAIDEMRTILKKTKQWQVRNVKNHIK